MFHNNIFPLGALMTIYLIIPGLIIFFINKWVKESFRLKKEQNDLLKELIRKMDLK